MADSATPPSPKEQTVTGLVRENAELRRQVTALSALRSQAELIELTHDSIMVSDLDGRIIFWNRGAEQTFGWSRDEAVGREVTDLLETVFPVDQALLLEQLMATGRWEGELTQTRRDGRSLVVASRWAVQRDDTDAPVAILVTSNDITEKKIAETALQESEERLKLAIAAGRLGVWEWDLISGEERWSDLCCQVLDLPDHDFGNRHDLFVNAVLPEDRPGQQEAQARAIATRTDYTHEFRIRRPDGSVRWISTRGKCFYDESGHPLRLLGVVSDTTERRLLEEELLKAQKLETIGVLAGGIAHDFNNMLTAILGNITLARHHLSADDAGDVLLAEAEKGCLSARGLTKQLLTFAKGGAPVRDATRIGTLIRETAGFILRGSPVAGTFDLPPDLPTVEIDAGQISQVLQNLIINAVQAMPTPGTVTVTAARHTAAADGPRLVAGREYVRISIRDEGIGIPDENLSRIFDPFFTTKENGTGLGLASAYSIMAQHEGTIEVESRQGGGTTFHLFLPAADGAVSHTSDQSWRSAPPGPARILVMDDDRKIRMVLERFLRSIGYEPVTVSDGAAAVARYRRERETGAPFAAVIMDLTVPGGMGGMEAMEQLLKFDPAITAIVSSGYSTDPIMANFREYGFQAVLAKPYQLNDLEQVVRRVVAV